MISELLNRTPSNPRQTDFIKYAVLTFSLGAIVAFGAEGVNGQKSKSTKPAQVTKKNDKIQPSKEPRLKIKERFAFKEKLVDQAETLSADGGLVFTLTTTPAEELQIPAAEYKRQIERYYADMGIKAVVLIAPNNTPLDNSLVAACIAGKVAGFIELRKIDSTFLDSMADKLKAAKGGKTKRKTKQD